MGKNLFRTVCFVLAALFTLAAVRGIFSAEFSAVLILPAMCAVVLIIVGYAGKRNISS